MVAQAFQTSAWMAMARDKRSDGGGGEEEAKGVVTAAACLQAALPALQRPQPPGHAATVAVTEVVQLHE